MPKTPSAWEIQRVQAEEFAEECDGEPEPSHSPGFSGIADQISSVTADETDGLYVKTDISVRLILNPTQTAWRWLTT